MIRLIESSEKFALNEFYTGVRRLDELQETYVHLGTQPAQRRVGRALALLAPKIGRRTDDGLLMLQNVSEGLLVDLAGTSIDTASRTPTGCERMGALIKEPGRIAVREAARLAELAEDLW